MTASRPDPLDPAPSHADPAPTILTVTANPSLDRTLELSTPLTHGAVQRARTALAEPGGKGVNVARVAAAAGVPTRAILPARAGDPLLTALDDVALPYLALPIDGEVRSNITVADPDGTTTKINAPGFVLDDAQARRLAELVLENARGARWVALCGSLPPGLPANWYRTVVDALSNSGCLVAVDTSGAPLAAAVTGRVDLLKPNDEELAEAVGADAAQLSAATARGDHAPLIEAAGQLVERTGAAILATLGASGALLVTATGSWFAAPPPIVPRSTVGAGDAALTGYLIAESRGAAEPERLRTAVAYGSAATALPGTRPPAPEQLDLSHVHVTELTGSPRAG
ncbi:hexose kinase [Gordonia sp. LSe1-13]|uniref:Hexose kinase n=1 Tax=Gordonia sesuvii TaxID=3116777 RepID=A0ABU7MBU0_9ACTN|nr:hexose kinase [Gordonia sp. LSe1-13]